MTAKLDRIKNSEAEGLRKMKLIYQKGIDSGISSPQEGLSFKDDLLGFYKIYLHLY